MADIRKRAAKNKLSDAFPTRIDLPGAPEVVMTRTRVEKTIRFREVGLETSRTDPSRT